ncbi:MAG: response regulator [Sphingobacteriales bacterium]|nr:MAG: response regulator [Sphingobacteriales bacterium]
MKRSVLIVEDDQELRSMLAHFLTMNDFEIIENDDLHGYDLSLLPDLILMDNKLTASTGSINCEVLKNNKYTNHIPVIIISGSAIEAECMAAGASAFIAKPFELKKLLHTIHEFMPL